ncbi:hypothetical protein [Sporocytophaga myxococcoides]|uniref:hypothetical protein n=1 Tax=Sporocytophaga myxococcoides TaxID=153721 RepID=UPI000401EC61|nr:hypothetical protein [Sporocytophaga myxococcoides]
MKKIRIDSTQTKKYQLSDYTTANTISFKKFIASSLADFDCRVYYHRKEADQTEIRDRFLFPKSEQDIVSGSLDIDLDFLFQNAHEVYLELVCEKDITAQLEFQEQN